MNTVTDELNAKQYLEHLMSERENGLGSKRDINIIGTILTRYAEISPHIQAMYDQLSKPQINRFIDLVIDSVALTEPEEALKVRREYKELQSINEKIGKLAFELAELIDKRSEIQEYSSFTSGTYYSVFQLVAESAPQNYEFQMYLKEKL
ncbi:hypothetical protein K0J45_07425 [Shewanella alkalitolerans]|uniref:hypothetical protein n=1 Tax=Shewanella alkalitolerans TaxID=2864209 RepID=UPI001C65714E|nr:hypothetical protein [Shewanella alkalitolerans]QYJ99023.1 hypothetical protein K0J45_07425 [Shewanella alkalitolerans]